MLVSPQEYQNGDWHTRQIVKRLPPGCDKISAGSRKKGEDVKINAEMIEITPDLLKDLLGGAMLVKFRDESYCGRLKGFSLAESARKEELWLMLGVEFSFIVRVSEVRGKAVAGGWHQYGYCMPFVIRKKGRLVGEKLVVETDLQETLVFKRQE